jgi:hypothetical protein
MEENGDYFSFSPKNIKVFKSTTRSFVTGVSGEVEAGFSGLVGPKIFRAPSILLVEKRKSMTQNLCTCCEMTQAYHLICLTIVHADSYSIFAKLESGLTIAIDFVHGGAECGVGRRQGTETGY